MAVAIRRASADDADFIASTILTAQRGHRPRGYFDFALNVSEPECLAFVRKVALARVRSQWHVSNFWIAEQNGVNAAALCALPVAEARTTVRPAIEEGAADAGLTESDVAGIWRRGAYARPCWRWGDDNNWMVEHVATQPSHRGQGMVQALLDHALKAGHAQGFTRASIGFYIGNDAAERCYRKAGFRFAEESRDPDFEKITGAPGFRRFERPIGAMPEPVLD
jgi:ribosomal protein S18 acetylase RimI-like enzyme